MWPKMATTGKGNIFEIAADRRWAFSFATTIPTYLAHKVEIRR